MRWCWRITIPRLILYGMFGIVISLAIPVVLIWGTPRWFNYHSARYVLDENEVSLPLRVPLIGLRSRIWHGVDEHWAWDEQFPTDVEGVGGVWAGLPFASVTRRVDYPIYEPEPGMMRMHPGYWFTPSLHHDVDKYRIAWIGLIVDLLIWGGALWGLHGTMILLRARRRISRDCCGRCGYSRSGLDSTEEISPECGLPVF